MKPYYFCSYFDSNYLSHGLTLIHSLKKYCEVPFTFYVLCLDEKVYFSLLELNISSVVLIKISEIEDWNPSLLEAKQDRSLVEYFFTMSPILPLYILKKFEVDIIACLDADLMFFSSPSSIYKELNSKSIYIIEHRFREEFTDHLISGKFNVQCQLFRNDKVGLDCLSRWSEQCINWCFDRHEDGKFADQKYLEEWPYLYGNDLVISKILGVGLAPWNVDGEEITDSDNGFLINGTPIIFFHFHGLKVFNRFFAKTGLSAYGAQTTKALRALYLQYLSNLFINNLSRKQKSIRNQNYGLIRMFLSGLKHKDLVIKLNGF